jgi:hypothetical protein
MTDDGVALPESAFEPFVRYSLYNSPYPAHDRGCAVDLYLDPDREDGDETAPSPVAGEVLETAARRVPAKEYAESEDHVLLLDTGEHVARLLHVEPTVEPGDRIGVGDPLGRLVRSGFFAPWVDNHVHLGFRAPDQNHLRAGGSLPLSLPESVRPEPLAWDATGRVREAGETYVVLDSPAAKGGWVGIGDDSGAVLDGGLAHYEGGGLLGGHGSPTGAGPDGPVSFLGYEVGAAEDRTVTWGGFDVLANGEPITGLSLFCARDAGFGAKLVCPGHPFAVGDRIEVSFRDSDDPVRLG